jgi:uncharacterized protein (DUF1015 family)
VADVQPFRGLRYNIERTGDISSVISPPYDIISPQEQQFYHRQSPYNVVRLELGEDQPSDSPGSNKYTRTANTLEKWLEDHILFREPLPAFYIFEHRFVHQGVAKRRWGLTARVRLREQSTGGARPHEVILESRIQDRLNLLRSCRVNFSPILGMVREGLLPLLLQLTRGDPDLSAVDHQGIAHHMWVIREEQSMAEVSAWCANKAVYIADGHHRYETALAYQREQQATRPHCSGSEAFNFVMMTLADAEDPGVVALPAHRLVRLPEPQSPAKLREELSLFFDLEELVPPAGAAFSQTLKAWLALLEERGKKGVAIGLYGLNNQRLYLITPQQMTKLQALLPPDRSQAWKDSDVTLLHWIVLRQIMGIDTPQKEEECLEYTLDEQEAIERVNLGEYQLAFLMNPIPISRVLAVADAGDRMPPKSTYFYPKLPTGLVMYPLWDDL